MDIQTQSRATRPAPLPPDLGQLVANLDHLAWRWRGHAAACTLLVGAARQVERLATGETSAEAKAVEIARTWVSARGAVITAADLAMPRAAVDEGCLALLRELDGAVDADEAHALAETEAA